jgi:hypothetical protein
VKLIKRKNKKKRKVKSKGIFGQDVNSSPMILLCSSMMKKQPKIMMIENRRWKRTNKSRKKAWKKSKKKMNKESKQKLKETKSSNKKS